MVFMCEFCYSFFCFLCGFILIEMMIVIVVVVILVVIVIFGY